MELRKFYFPMSRVPVPHLAGEDIMTEYWEWHPELGWQNYNDWYVDDNGVPTDDKTHCKTTRGPESPHAWNCLLEQAKLYGYPQGQDNTWYIALMNYCGHWYPLVAAGGESYHNFKQFCPDIAAERFGVTDEQINDIDGFVGLKREKPNRLNELVQRLNNGELLDAQKELDIL